MKSLHRLRSSLSTSIPAAARKNRSNLAIPVARVITTSCARAALDRTPWARSAGSPSTTRLRDARAPTRRDRGTAMTLPESVSAVLVPVDGSHLSMRAIPIASCLAQRLHADLHLLRAVRTVDEIAQRDAELAG